MRIAIVMAMVLGAAGCGGDEDVGGGSEYPTDLPAMDSSYRIEGDAIVCDDALSMFCSPEGPGPYNRCGCNWHHVTYEGIVRCNVQVLYTRALFSDPWGEPSIYTSPASACVDW